MKLALKKNAFEIENIEEFMKIIVAEDKIQQEYYARMMIPSYHIPLQRMLSNKFQAEFNYFQRQNVDHDLQEMGYEIWNTCRDATWQVKWHMLNWHRDNRNGHAKVNTLITMMIVIAVFLFGLLFGGLR